MNANLATLLEGFFSRRLIDQRKASPHTVASYRDTFRLLLKFAAEKRGRSPATMSLTDVGEPLLSEFLEQLEKGRGCGARSRNQRLAAIRSFFQYTAIEAPEHASVVQRVLAIPTKRTVHRLIDFLERKELEALLGAVDRQRWLGRRNHALLLTMAQTGLRLSETTALRIADVELRSGPHVRCLGKGRKERSTPLARSTVAVLSAWIKELGSADTQFLFPTARGGTMSADAVQRMLRQCANVARRSCPSLERKHVTPHVLRHTAAMELLQAGIDRSLIAIWLGHESVETTQLYFNASLALKERIMAKTQPFECQPAPFKPDDQLLAFLQAL